ncbi:hypothetical protein CEXT_221721 [Caerostris extrusa]|uniref:Uncharacterized protein n=1 Tax=Caerostris extrusa TaxID=172846 RepID=A0AAV4Y8Z8_CAEEX|nr:hypothetical protein CEXT_221721 [Caerostris extrusa]
MTIASIKPFFIKQDGSQIYFVIATSHFPLTPQTKFCIFEKFTIVEIGLTVSTLVQSKRPSSYVITRTKLHPYRVLKDTRSDRSTLPLALCTLSRSKPSGPSAQRMP